MIELEDKLSRVRRAARSLRASSGEIRSEVLRLVAVRLEERQKEILAANQSDLAALPQQATPAFRDRLLLSPERLRLAGESLRQVAALPDPVGEVVETRVLGNGLRLRRVRSPLGVLFLIFESRPNVALESFSLALKSANAIVLKGGKESLRTTAEIYRLIEEAMAAHGLAPEAVWGITSADRSLVKQLLSSRQYIDVVIPRGGDALIDFVVEHSAIPIIKNDRGLCHVYVHQDADFGMATRIVVNAKTQRPGVCNAMETVLVDAAIHQAFLPQLYAALGPKQVEWRGCPLTVAALSGKARVVPASEKDWDTEYLDLKMNCRVVEGLESALAHIEAHGSHHSEAIVTQSREAAFRFQSEVDAAAVYWNASTRFTDGFEFGLGGEIGISTQKLHVRGPVGLKELTSVRWVIDGAGQTRE